MSSNGVFILFMVCALLKYCLTGKLAATERSIGYTTIPIQLRNCTKTTLPYDKQPMGEIILELKNGIFKGVFTVLRDKKSMKVGFQDYYYEDGQWHLALYVRNLNCRIGIVSAMTKIFGINFNKKTCSVPKGTYQFEVDYKKIDLIWVGERRIGRIRRRVEVYSKDGTMACYELEANVKKSLRMA